MSFINAISVLAGLLFVIGYIPYVRAIVRREATPAKASWIIWAALDTLTMLGMIVHGTINGHIIGSTVGAWVVMVLGIKLGTPGWTRLDIFCLIGAVLGIVLWQVFSSPIVGIITSLVVMLLGSFPTFASAWRDPSKENRTGWTLFWLSCIPALFAIPAWTLGDAAQPIVFTIIESVMMFILYIKPLVLSRLTKLSLRKRSKSVVNN
jgi:hypothetical protein